jgi:hypothetical protein
MEKAFEFIEWHFLFKILKLLDFNSIWILCIWQCLSTISFSILMDGSPFEKFSLSYGWRQDDPLSPFLFIMGLEILSRLIHIKISRLDRGSLTSIKSCPNTYCIWWGKMSILQNLVSCLAKIATPQFKHPLFLLSFYP